MEMLSTVHGKVGTWFLDIVCVFHSMHVTLEHYLKIIAYFYEPTVQLSCSDGN